MTIEEVSKRYLVPKKILQGYEKWGKNSGIQKMPGQWQYDEQDLEYISLFVTLHDIGLRKQETEAYMTLMRKGSQTEEERLMILDKKRGKILDEIHAGEQKLEHLDYLRYEIQKNQCAGQNEGRKR